MSTFTIFLLIIVYLNEMSRCLAANDWFVSRAMWQMVNYTETADAYSPLRLVVVHHTATEPCTKSTCDSEMRTLQANYHLAHNSDVPYNFVIGNDGRVYEGRGWNVAGAHSLGYNKCSLGLAFMGDYREGESTNSKVTEVQEKRAHMLLEEGVKMGFLHPDFKVLGAKDLRPTLNPGDNLYNAIKKWTHYDHLNRFKDHTCDQIKELSLIVAGASSLLVSPLVILFTLSILMNNILVVVS